MLSLLAVSDCARYGGRAGPLLPAAMHQAPVAEQGAKARQQVPRVHRTTVVESARRHRRGGTQADQVRRSPDRCPQRSRTARRRNRCADSGRAPQGVAHPPPRVSRISPTRPGQTVTVFRPVRFCLLLERVRSHLEGEVALGLSFEGSYSQTKPKEPAYGGHASAMGPAPRRCPPPDDGSARAGRIRRGRAPAGADLLRRPDEGSHPRVGRQRRRALRLRRRRPAGHLPGDRRRADAGRAQRIPHRNALYRNKGHWTFEDVSKQAGRRPGGLGQRRLRRRLTTATAGSIST